MAKVLDYATSSRLDAPLKYLLFVVGLALVIDFFDKIVFIRNYTKIQESITNNIKKDVISSYFEIDNKELGRVIVPAYEKEKVRLGVSLA